MNLLEYLPANSTGLQIGFSVGLIVGYCLCKIVHKRRKQPSNKSNNLLTDDFDHYKLVLVVRTDLKMGKGKIAAQCGHAAVTAYKNAIKHPKILKGWERAGQAKITVQVDSETKLMEIAKNAKRMGLAANIVQDAGHTQIAAGSTTVCAVGPGPASAIDEITGHLKLL